MSYAFPRGLGAATADVSNAGSIPFQYSNMRQVDSLVAPWVSDVELRAIDMAQDRPLPMVSDWAYGPWIPSEGPIARTVYLEKVLASTVSAGQGNFSLGTWLASMTTGQMTGTKMYIVQGRVNGERVLYAVTADEYRQLPPNTYFTVALENNSSSIPLEYQDVPTPYGPVLNGGVPVTQGGGTIPYPTVPSGNWGNIFPTTLPGSVWPFPSPSTGGGNIAPGTPAQPAAPSTAGISTTDILLILAGCVGAYMFVKRNGGFRPNAKTQHEWDKWTRDWETDRSNHSFILAQQWKDRGELAGPRKKRSHYPAHRHHREYPLIDTYKDKDDMRGLLYRLHDHEAAERTSR